VPGRADGIGIHRSLLVREALRVHLDQRAIEAHGPAAGFVAPMGPPAAVASAAPSAISEEIAASDKRCFITIPFCE
jgi:hypothetical protein